MMAKRGSLEWREKLKGRHNSGEFKKGLISWITGKTHNLETRKKISEKILSLHLIPHSKGIFKKKIKFNCKTCGKEVFDYPTNKSKFCSAICHNKDLPWWIKKGELNPRRFCKLKPTKPEIFLTTFLNKNFPNEWEYVGDGKVWIEGFNPDFINCNGKKLIIEYNGKYWHNLDDVKLRDKRKLETYAKYGYRTLTLSDIDLKEPNALANTITTRENN